MVSTKPRICTYDGCDIPTFRTAYCTKHYKRLYRGQSLDGMVECASCFAKFEKGVGRIKYCEECRPPGDTQATRLLSVYGITVAMRDAMYFDQDGQCTMPGCSNEATDVDHWHGCLEGHKPDLGCLKCVRALVCKSCNLKIGVVETYADRVAEYNKEWLGV